MNIREFILQMASSVQNSAPSYVNPVELAMIYQRKHGHIDEQSVFQECENLVRENILQRQNQTPNPEQLNANLYFMKK